MFRKSFDRENFPNGYDTWDRKLFAYKFFYDLNHSIATIELRKFLLAERIFWQTSLCGIVRIFIVKTFAHNRCESEKGLQMYFVDANREKFHDQVETFIDGMKNRRH